MKKIIKNHIIGPEETLLDAILRMENNKCKTLLVVKKKRVLGTLSEGDIIRSFSTNTKYYSKVSNAMTTNFKYLIEKNEKKIIDYYFKYNLGLIPICKKNNTLVDIIIVHESLRKILRALQNKSK